MRNLKAQGNLDIATLLIEFFGMIIMVWIGTLIYQGFTTGNTSIANAPLVTNSVIATRTINNGSGLFKGLNNVLAFGFILMALGSVLAAFFTESHPALAFIGILISPLEILLAFGFHDAFFSIITGSSAFGQLATQYPLTVAMFQYLPIMTFVLAVIIAIVTFGKQQ